MDEQTIINSEIDKCLSKIELQLNVLNGSAFTPEDRTMFITQIINKLSHKAGYVNLHLMSVVRQMRDFLDIEIDFEKEFPDDPEGYRAAWDNLKTESARVLNEAKAR